MKRIGSSVLVIWGWVWQRTSSSMGYELTAYDLRQDRMAQLTQLGGKAAAATGRR